ncbi:MAG: XdhC/CoxI family protein [Polyangiales bacterium]
MPLPTARTLHLDGTLERTLDGTTDGDESLPRPRAADIADVLQAASTASGTGDRVVLATVLDRRGSAPSTAGQKLVLTESGIALGTVGGGAIEREVLMAMQRWLHDEESEGRAAKVTTFKLGPSLGMCCGGGVDILIESIPTSPPVLLVGGGHIGTALSTLLAQSGFAVTLCDERESWLCQRQVDARVRCIEGDFAFAGKSTSKRGMARTMTHDHQLEQRVIEWALLERFACVGGVGSRAKIAKTRARLLAKGHSEEDAQRVRMPLGLDIGARTPFEIAISIVAELIAWRRAKALPSHGFPPR